MLAKQMVLGGFCVASIVAAFGTVADADNITLSGVACRNYNPNEAADIDYAGFGTGLGAQNINNSSPRFVICPVPRSPLTGNPPTQLYIDGSNSNGSTTSCTAMLLDYTGNFRATVSFTEGATSPWDHAVTFNVAPMLWDYIAVLCQLPVSRTGTLFGVASVAQ
jgi:hypothetical protein